MDVTTFYALFSATCFALVGFWWSLVAGHPHWLADPARRRAVGGVYLAFLLPAAMGLFAQVGGAGTTTVWRVSFVVFAVVGAAATVWALPVSSRAGGGASDAVLRVAAFVVYALVAVVGVVPELGAVADLRPIQVEAMLLIVLVLIANGLVWRFMVAEHAGDEYAGREMSEGHGQHPGG